MYDNISKFGKLENASKTWNPDSLLRKKFLTKKMVFLGGNNPVRT